MRWYAIGGFLVLAALGWYFNDKALSNLATDDEETRKRVWRKGPLAGRALFSEAGWKYRRIAWLLSCLALAYLLVVGLMTM